MEKELVESLQDFLWCGVVGAASSEQILEWISKQGYVVIKKDNLIKHAGLIVAKKLGV